MRVKPRKPWLAGILSFFQIGLGHIYTGYARRGIVLFFLGQALLFLVFVPLIYNRPTAASLLAGLLSGFALLVYCVCDAVKRSRRHKFGYKLKRYNRWYVYLGCWVLASFVIQPVFNGAIKRFIVQAYKIPAGSLKPTLLVGDHILARKLLAVKREGINRGDIIIFQYPADPAKLFTKRVVAMGGETIEIADKVVLVDGVALEEPYTVCTDPRILPEDMAPRDNFGPVTVPRDAFFVMGDNRDQSNDSRYWGFVDKSAVKGKACAIYWSWDKETFRVRWNRIGKRIE